MPKRKKGRIQKRMASARVDEKHKDRIRVNYSFPSELLPDVEEEERRLAKQFPEVFPEIVRQWSQLTTLHRILIEKRTALEDQSDVRIALDLLGSKAFADGRGAQVLLQQGYAMASLGPLRAALEAADLMDYLLKNPPEATHWLGEDQRFDRLDWVRKKLPVDPTPFYEFLNWGMHANWRFIPHLMRKPGGPLDTLYEIIPGPVRNDFYTELLSSAAIFTALKIIAILHDHRRDLVSELWREQFDKCRDRNMELQKKLQHAATEATKLLKAFAEIIVRGEEDDK